MNLAMPQMIQKVKKPGKLRTRRCLVLCKTTASIAMTFREQTRVGPTNLCKKSSIFAPPGEYE